MDILHPAAVIGTNSWGSAAYSIMVRGSYVKDETIQKAMQTAKRYDLKIYDLARDYGFGKAQKMIGDFGTEGIYISAKYTPFSGYKAGCVRKSLEKDLKDFHRECRIITVLFPVNGKQMDYWTGAEKMISVSGHGQYWKKECW